MQCLFIARIFGRKIASMPRIQSDAGILPEMREFALGVRVDGRKETLGLWIEQNEGAKFWLGVMNEIRRRGTEDILIAIVDGLKGFPEAINAVFAQTQVQTCIVHLLRNCLDFVPWKDRKAIVAALQRIYQARNAQAAQDARGAFEGGVWGVKYPAIPAMWRRHWTQIIPFFAFPDGVRKIIYTTNSIESLNAKLRRAVRARTLSKRCRSDEAALSGLEPRRERLENATKGMDHGQNPIRHPLR